MEARLLDARHHPLRAGRVAVGGDVFTGDPAWRVERALRDGRCVTFRPAVPGDREELRREFERLPGDSRYSRFMGAVSMSDPLLDYLTRVDQRQHVAIGVVLDGQGVGIGRFIRDGVDAPTAEFAVTVVPAVRGLHIGAMLLEELRRAAAFRGIRELRADVLATNVPMRALLARVGARLVDASSAVGGLVYALPTAPGP